MKKILVALAALMLVSPAFVNAQTATKRLTIAWTLPIVAVDGTALTGTQALTEVQVFMAGAPIPDTSTMAPTLKLAKDAVNTVQNYTLPVGGTAYVRLKACNLTGCSDFSAQSSFTFPTSVPAVPTSVTITVTLQ